MNKLPEVLIQVILSFFYKPSDCFSKKLEQFAYIDKLTYNLSKKIRDKCDIEYVNDKKICKTHCKAYPIHKKLELEFIKNKNTYFVHFENRYLTKFAMGEKGLKRKYRQVNEKFKTKQKII